MRCNTVYFDTGTQTYMNHRLNHIGSGTQSQSQILLTCSAANLFSMQFMTHVPPYKTLFVLGPNNRALHIYVYIYFGPLFIKRHIYKALHIYVYFVASVFMYPPAWVMILGILCRGPTCVLTFVYMQALT